MVALFLLFVYDDKLFMQRSYFHDENMKNKIPINRKNVFCINLRRWAYATPIILCKSSQFSFPFSIVSFSLPSNYRSSSSFTRNSQISTSMWNSRYLFVSFHCASIIIFFHYRKMRWLLTEILQFGVVVLWMRFKNASQNIIHLLFLLHSFIQFSSVEVRTLSNFVFKTTQLQSADNEQTRDNNKTQMFVISSILCANDRQANNFNVKKKNKWNMKELTNDNLKWNFLFKLKKTSILYRFRKENIDKLMFSTSVKYYINF